MTRMPERMPPVGAFDSGPLIARSMLRRGDTLADPKVSAMRRTNLNRKADGVGGEERAAEFPLNCLEHALGELHGLDPTAVHAFPKALWVLGAEQARSAVLLELVIGCHRDEPRARGKPRKFV